VGASARVFPGPTQGATQAFQYSDFYICHTCFKLLIRARLLALRRRQKMFFRFFFHCPYVRTKSDPTMIGKGTWRTLEGKKKHGKPN
jgi:hypothetical protein